MSSRSNAWYQVPANRERRKARMRAYGQALVCLGQQYPDERVAEYRAGVADGLGPTAAQDRAGKRLREAHPDEFRQIYEEKLRDEQ